ncbi:MAG: hypothetical protein O3B24_11205 [Verrucomicrobia bacterium]|nr:hypothetical protein [Verrucomicrobiota bacterium]
MKKSLFVVASVAMASVVVLGSVLLSGCEEGKGTHALDVSPSFADLTSGFTNFTQTFTVSEESLRDLSLPLVWRVSNPALGNITISGGRTAAYTRSNAHGDNGIFVEDQFGAEGAATIRQ